MNEKKSSKKTVQVKAITPNIPAVPTSTTFQSVILENTKGIAILFVFFIIFFHEQIFGINNFWGGYWADWAEVFVPFLKLNTIATQNGELPFWNPYAFGGTPHLADPNNMYFYPFFLLIEYFANGDSDFFSIVKNLILIHFFITAINMFLLARHIKIGLWESVFASVAFTFSCTVVCRWQFVPILFSISWLPLIALFFYKMATSTRINLTNIAAGAFFLAMSFSGHPQYFFYNLLFLGLILLFRILQLLRTYGFKTPNNILVNTTTSFFVAFVLAIGLLSIQVFHTLEMIPYTLRDVITFDFASDGSLKFSNFLSFLSPKIFGYFKGNEAQDFVSYFLTQGKIYHYWETTYFFGVIPLIFGLFGLYKIPKKGLVIPLLFTSVFMVLHALGSTTFFYKLLFNLPGFNLFRIPSRTMLYVVLLLCLLAAYSVGQMGKQNISKKDKWSFYIILSFLAIGCLYIMSSLGLKYGLKGKDLNTQKIYGVTAFVMLMVSVIYFIFSQKVHKHRSFLTVGLILCTFIDLCIPNKDYKNGSQDPALNMAMEESNLSALKPKKGEIFRYAPTDLKGRIFSRNQATFNQFYSMDGFYGFVFKQPDQVASDFPMNKIFNIKLKSDIKTDASGNRQAFFNEQDILPHQRMSYHLITDPNKELYKTVEFLNTSIVDTLSSITLSGKNQSEVNNSVQETYYGYSKTSYDVQTAEPGLLVIGDYYFPNWQAYIDGQKTDVLRTNFLTRGVIVPEGKHKVEFKFESAYFNFGRWVTIISLLIIVLIVVIDRFLLGKIHQTEVS